MDFLQTPRRTRLFAGFIVPDQCAHTPKPSLQPCENPALPAPGKEFQQLNWKN
jgi:hypothetical protein